jgi:Cytochrome c peroxidase
MNKNTLVSVFLTSLLLVGCGGSHNDNETEDKLRNTITALNLDGDPSDQSQVHPIPEISGAKAQLGKKLFFSKTLSGEEDTACVSCHHPLLGGGDDLSLPIGVHAVNENLLGPGRLHDVTSANLAGMEYDGGPTVPRNAPTVFNFMLYKDSVFHDGRIQSLADGTVSTPDSAGSTDNNAANLVHGQALFPVTSPEEMASSTFVGSTNDQLRQQLADRLTDNASWQSEFDAVYGSNTNITYDLIADAMASYEASQLFINSPWKAFVDGDNTAISSSAKSGALLFFTDVTSGGAGCMSCHSGDFFTDEKFHNIALPQIGRGKGDGVFGDDDFGRFKVTKVESDRYAFRTPTLLNVTATGPYGRVGSYDSLEEVVRHHLNPTQALDTFDFNLVNLAQENVQKDNAEDNSRAALEVLIQQQDNGTSLLNNVDLSDGQVAQVVSFLQSLTDPCVEDDVCLQPWIAESDENLDVFQAQFQ